MYFFTFLVLLINIRQFVTCNIVVARTSDQGNTSTSTIKFYTGSTSSDFVSYDLTTAQNVADHIRFDLKRPNMIFFHGWRQSPETTASQDLLNAYLANGTFNVLALDWREAAADNRVDIVVQRVDPHGIAVALFIDRWNTEKGVPFSKIHLVGHSLGAHLAGSVGKHTQSWSGQTKYIDRITGLDPAIIGTDFLQWRYARFVDIIHTDPNKFGTSKNTGHVDFWPNIGVSLQPGCVLRKFWPGCSHVRALVFYTESVQRANRTGNFLSINKLDASIIIEMGLNCPTSNVQGVYTLYTNGASWFSKS